MRFLYFAYGSNMLPARLTKRCNSARHVGTATAHGFQLEFSKRSKDGSGKATLVPSESQMATPGALFEIDRCQLEELDKAEGKGNGYDRKDTFRITCDKTGDILTATTYRATAPDPALQPFDWYLALVLAGCLYHELPREHQDRLRATTYKIDTQEVRSSREDAIEALSDHGYRDSGRFKESSHVTTQLPYQAGFDGMY